MRRKAISLTLQYCERTPIQWLRTAAASLDESLAALLLRRWSDARVPPARRGRAHLSAESELRNWRA